MLYGAIELARFTEPAACRLLRAHIGEQAATLHIRREDGPELEIDAFLIPLFVRSSMRSALWKDLMQTSKVDVL